MNEQVKDIYTSEIFISKYINSKYKNKLNTDTLNYRVNSVKICSCNSGMEKS